MTEMLLTACRYDYDVVACDDYSESVRYFDVHCDCGSCAVVYSSSMALEHGRWARETYYARVIAGVLSSRSSAGVSWCMEASMSQHGQSLWPDACEDLAHICIVFMLTLFLPLDPRVAWRRFGRAPGGSLSPSRCPCVASPPRVACPCWRVLGGFISAPFFSFFLSS